MNLFEKLYIRFRPLTKAMILKKAKCYQSSGLCYAIKRALLYYGYNIHYTCASDVKDILQIPLYDVKEAVKFNADIRHGARTGFWWTIGVWNKGRLDYLNWLINQYKNDKTDLKEYLEPYKL